MSALAYCAVENITYVHQRWGLVDHPPSGLSRAQWGRVMEEFHGLVRNECHYDKRMKDHIQVLGPRACPALADPEKMGYYFNPQVLTMLRHKYSRPSTPMKNNTESFLATKNQFRVAVHIRRGDILQRNDFGLRFTANNETIAMMKVAEEDALRAKPRLNRGDFAFHIYSEGSPDDFDDIAVGLGRNRVHLHVGEKEDLRENFHDMVTADILLMAKSGLSYAAAILSTGKIYYQDLWYPPLPHWHRYHNQVVAT